VYAEFSVKLDDMTAVTAIPIEVPNCETVLNTAPARACVVGGNTSVITRLATVKIAVLSKHTVLT
jgi:hypothetical protein